MQHLVSSLKNAERKGRRLFAIVRAICSRGDGLAALHENPPAARRLVRYCSVCGAVCTTIFGGLRAKENFTVSLGYGPATITNLKFNKPNKHGACRRRSRPEFGTVGLWASWRAGCELGFSRRPRCFGTGSALPPGGIGYSKRILIAIRSGPQCHFRQALSVHGGEASRDP